MASVRLQQHDALTLLIASIVPAAISFIRCRSVESWTAAESQRQLRQQREA